jgi:hypothetical protein
MSPRPTRTYYPDSEPASLGSFYLEVACLSEKKLLPVIDRVKLTIYRIRDEHTNHYTTAAVTFVEQLPCIGNSLVQFRHFWQPEQSANLDNSMYRGNNSHYCGMTVGEKAIRLPVHGEIALTCSPLIFFWMLLRHHFDCKKFRLHLIFPVCTLRVRSSL